ncbi:MAG: cytochrome c biogenesis protein CcsA [Methylohalobius sp.]|nr:cytochrome c biogenesis protein CcsA [Methylohalobius sp.]
MAAYPVAVFAVVLYLAVTLGLLRRRQDNLLAQRPVLLAAAWVGLLLHGTALAGLALTPQGLDLGFFSTAALVSLMVVFLFLLAAIEEPVDKLGIVILPLAAITLVFRLIFPAEVRTLSQVTLAMQVHILASILAFSLLNIAAVQALLLACQDMHLHRKRSGWFARSLPPLQTMERLLFQMIGTGFCLLSLSLASGWLFVHDLFAQHLVHKTVLSILSWLVFGGLLFGRRFYGWRGRTAIRWTLWGFLALLLAYFGSKLVLELILHRT